MRQFKNLWDKFVEGEKFRDTPRSLKEIMENLPADMLSFYVVSKRNKVEGDTSINEYDVYEISNSPLVFRIKKLDWKLLEKNGTKINGVKLSSDALALNNLEPLFDYEFNETLRHSWVSVPNIPGVANNEKRFFYIDDLIILNKKENVGNFDIFFGAAEKQEVGNATRENMGNLQLGVKSALESMKHNIVNSSTEKEENDNEQQQ